MSHWNAINILITIQRLTTFPLLVSNCIDVIPCLIHQTRAISPPISRFSFLFRQLVFLYHLSLFFFIHSFFFRAVNFLYSFSFLLYLSFFTFNVLLSFRPFTILPPVHNLFFRFSSLYHSLYCSVIYATLHLASSKLCLKVSRTFYTVSYPLFL